MMRILELSCVTASLPWVRRCWACISGVTLVQLLFNAYVSLHLPIASVGEQVLQGMSGKALRDLLSSVGRPFSGKKALLVARLMGDPPPGRCPEISEEGAGGDGRGRRSRLSGRWCGEGLLFERCARNSYVESYIVVVGRS